MSKPSSYIKQDEFIRIANDCNQEVSVIHEYIKENINPTQTIDPIYKRLKSYREKGLLVLESGNKVSYGEVLKGTSTLYGPNGEIKQQWVKSDVPLKQQLEATEEAITELVKAIQPLEPIQLSKQPQHEELLTMYISNDIHFGALMWEAESGEDWDLNIATKVVRQAYDYLFETSPSTKYAIVVDLGDLMEVDNFSNMTPKSGNILASDSRYPKILRASYEALVYAIQRALEKHEFVYFYNIAGNHDMASGHAVREIIYAYFKDNSRVIIDESPNPIKYHQHGSTLFQFAHGDGMKMKDAGEVMAHDCQDIFSSTTHRYAHFGHNHKDSVVEGRLCKAESHRNLAPLNHWAHHKGFRGPLGTMKSITYSDTQGEKGRNLFNIS